MNYLTNGQFFGQTDRLIQLEGITLTDTIYTHKKVDWHYHQNSYFTFILQGKVIEGNKKETYTCPAGTLLFHNWQEPHYNVKPEGFTRGFHIELEENWLNKLEISTEQMQGSIKVMNPDIKFLFYKIFQETKINDSVSLLSIENLLVQVLDTMQHDDAISTLKKPEWVKIIQDFLHDNPLQEKISLSELARISDIHPVHISRQFPKYFACSLGEYLRKIKVEKALSMLSHPNTTLTHIAQECGFADQSHFIRCFREQIGMSPLPFRTSLLR